MLAIFRRLHRALWLKRASAVLQRPPFHWPKALAASYVTGLYHLYLEEGCSPAEAIECDRQYWEG
jgi:hypothetical protein